MVGVCGPVYVVYRRGHRGIGGECEYDSMTVLTLFPLCVPNFIEKNNIHVYGIKSLHVFNTNVLRMLPIDL